MKIDQKTIKELENRGYKVFPDKSKSGGMGSVCEGEQIELERRVALKRSDLEDDYAENEIKALLKISAQGQNLHIENIIGKIKTTNETWIVKEFVDGIDLRTLIEDLQKKNVHLSINGCIKIVKEILEAIKYCHEKGVLHHDLHPRNIMITKEGNGIVKVVDFGLAKSVNGKTTHYGAGALDYQAPEYYFKKETTFKKSHDLYSIGIIFFELLTRDRPYIFEGELRKYTSEMLYLREGIPEQIFECLNHWLLEDHLLRKTDLYYYYGIIKKYYQENKLEDYNLNEEIDKIRKTPLSADTFVPYNSRKHLKPDNFSLLGIDNEKDSWSNDISNVLKQNTPK